MNLLCNKKRQHSTHIWHVVKKEEHRVMKTCMNNNNSGKKLNTIGRTIKYVVDDMVSALDLLFSLFSTFIHSHCYK